MNKISFLLFLTAAILLYGCDDSSNDFKDAGITTEDTERYFGFVDKKTITYEGTQTIQDSSAPVSFEVTIDADSQTFSFKTFKVTWRSSIGIPLIEWYKVEGDSVYRIAQEYTEGTQEKRVIFKNPILFGKNPLKDGQNLKTESDGETYTYIVSNYQYKTFRNDFGEVKRIIGSEGNASNEYYLKENDGFVGFKFSNHPALFSIEVEKIK